MKNTNFGAEVARIMPRFLREFGKSQHKDIFSKVSLTVPQILILEFMFDKGPCKMGELARILNFTMSAVTAIIDRMIKLKLVMRERSVEDRRVVNVSLLNKGKETVEK